MIIGMMMVHVQILELTWDGQMAHSLFRTTADLLREGDFQKSLEFVAPKRKMEPYRDAIDFLFCELVPGFRRDCFRFYEGKGPALREMPCATPETVAAWDLFLSASLHVARAAMEQARRLSWRRFRDTTKAVLLLAG